MRERTWGGVRETHLPQASMPYAFGVQEACD
jgi:hypothetical protein